ncbi:MAG: T9SS type A sorting domain-containing protein [Bacteroidetes bacterium]|nr:T9SS type A sorting domain-containing protein [Bacteroidota bacterium]
MKAKYLLLIIFTSILSIAIFAQDQVSPVDNNFIPKEHNFIPTDLSSVTTTDNENNAGTGSPDYDMDVYLYKVNPKTPIEFNIFIDDATVTNAQLSILAWDVDWVGHHQWIGELDAVYVNGHFVGYLTGANDEWSTSVFFFDPSFIIPGPAGKNLVKIELDERNEGWAVNVDWGQLVINGATGIAEFRYVTTDKSVYSPGETVYITEEVDADPSLYVRVETNLLDPASNIIAGTSRLLTATTGDEPFTEALALPVAAVPGAYQVMAILYEAGTNIQQDLVYVPFTVAICVDPTYGGEIGNAQSNCGEFDPAVISSIALPTGYTGTLEYKWQVSLDNSTFYDLASSNSETYDPGLLIQTHWFKRLARVDCMPDWTGAAESNIIEITVFPVPSVDAGLDEQIYIGYPPYSTQLNAVGSVAGSYLWSPATGLSDPNVADPIAAPETTTTYTVTFTDGNACTATDEVTVNVMDVRCGKKMDKVLVCHVPPGNPGNCHTICIAYPAVQAHLDLGSYLGYCLIEKTSIAPETLENVALKVFPNPMDNSCKIELSLNSPSSVEIYITDIFGKRVADVFKGALVAGQHDYSWNNATETGKAIYLLTVITDTETKTIKLLVK